jgi:anhydro-N-acetylmuramic acid kinase
MRVEKMITTAPSLTTAPAFTTALGFMSGTSMDGVDAAVVISDGESVQALGETFARPYTGEERQILRDALDEARILEERTARPLALQRAEEMLHRAHMEAFATIQALRPPSAPPIELIGFHGQTVLHDPARHLTVQIGDGQRLANETRIPVVYDFRAADVAAGGHGAPLVPVVHRAMALGLGIAPPLAFVNIGGVGNITLIGQGDALSAFDTGPGNALIDDWMQHHTGARMDMDGRAASCGTVDARALGQLMDDPYFARAAPKSLDRDHFRQRAARIIEPLSLEDGAATLTAFTAASIALAAGAHLNGLIVCGGGARNPALLAALGSRLLCPLTIAEDHGLSSEFMEAQAFAVLAVRSRCGLPLSYPGTTGAPRPMPGGRQVFPA